LKTRPYDRFQDDAHRALDAFIQHSAESGRRVGTDTNKQ
jgi:hypothetical protein